MVRKKKEEYKIVEQKKPVLRRNGLFKSPASQTESDRLESLGIKNGSYDLRSLKREDMNVIDMLSHTYNGEEYDKKDLMSISRRFMAYNDNRIYTAQRIDNLFAKMPDAAAVYTFNAIMDIMEFLGDKNVEADFSEDEKESFESLYAYCEECSTKVHVEPPNQNDVTGWKKLLYKMESLLFSYEYESMEEMQ